MDYKDMKFMDALKYLPTRALNAFSKLLGIKGFVLYITYSLIKNDHIPAEAVAYVWISVMVIVVFGDKALNVIKDIKK